MFVAALAASRSNLILLQYNYIVVFKYQSTENIHASFRRIEKYQGKRVILGSTPQPPHPPNILSVKRVRR